MVHWKNWSHSGSAAGWTQDQAAGLWTLQDLLHYSLQRTQERAAVTNNQRNTDCWEAPRRMPELNSTH